MLSSKLDGIVLSQTGKLQDISSVAGGSCICFSKGNPLRLALQDLIDSFIPVLFASQFNVPAYIYFQTFESDLMSSLLVFDPACANYSTMWNYLLKGVTAIAHLYQIQIPPIICLDTSEPFVKDCIDKTVLKLKNTLPIDKLYGLYQVKEVSCYPKGKPEELLMLEVYYRNLSLYDNVFFNFLNRESMIGTRLTTENYTQSKAIKTVGIGDYQAHTAALFYLPAPNCQNKEMNLGNRNHKIELGLSKEQIKQRTNKLFSENPSAYDYYRSIFPDHSIEQIMSIWKSACQI